jgi:hypothetical protein
MDAVDKSGLARQNVNSLEVVTPEFAGRHYSPSEIAELWNLSVDTVRKLFEKEVGVLVLKNTRHRHGKRTYTTLRIPESVVERVHRRLSKV